jgi:hypothetical protein
MGVFDFLTGKKTVADAQAAKAALETRHTAELDAANKAIADAQATEAAAAGAPIDGTAPVGGRRTRKGRKGSKKGKSRRVRSGR